MDQNLVAALRKTLEAKSTADLRRAYESGEKGPNSPEEREAVRQLLYERRSKSIRPVVALVSAVVCGVIGATWAWWQGWPDGMVPLAGIGGAILGFASWYVRDIIPRV